MSSRLTGYEAGFETTWDQHSSSKEVAGDRYEVGFEIVPVMHHSLNWIG